MRILFIGSTKFGLKCLEEIERLKNINIAGVITGKKEFKISYSKNEIKNALFADFGPFCKQKKIPLYTLRENMRESALVEFIDNCKAELGLVAGWYHLIPKELLVKFNFAGLHASLLPKYRGGAPLVWALINGEKATGITFFMFADKVDSGPIVGQKKVKIGKTDDISSLYEKIEEAGVSLLKECLAKLAKGNFIPKPQDESKRTIFPQRKPDDGLIDWNWDGEKIRNFIRAQTKPYPGAYTIINNKKIIIWDAEITPI